MTNRVLFLDFDGVLNSREYINIRGRGDVLDPAAGRSVQDIINWTGCHLVISSTWRLLHSKIDLQVELDFIGIHKQILDFTPNLNGAGRGNEILAWLEKNPSYTNFVVLDDESFDMEPVMDHLVKTDFKTGIKKEHVEQAIRLFFKQSEKLSCKA